MNTLIASSLITSAHLCWTPEAQIQVKEIIDVQPSPDHSKVLFVGSEPCLTGDKGHSITKICLATIHNGVASEPVCLAEPLASMPKWSPDGKWIAFLSEQGETNTLSLVHADAGLDAYHLDSSIATIDLSAGKITPWDKHAVYEAMPRYSPEGKNDTLILYPEMGHRISDPKMVLDSMQRNLVWFQTHLSDNYQ